MSIWLATLQLEITSERQLCSTICKWDLRLNLIGNQSRQALPFDLIRQLSCPQSLRTPNGTCQVSSLAQQTKHLAAEFKLILFRPLLTGHNCHSLRHHHRSSRPLISLVCLGDIFADRDAVLTSKQTSVKCVCVCWIDHW